MTDFGCCENDSPTYRAKAALAEQHSSTYVYPVCTTAHLFRVDRLPQCMFLTKPRFYIELGLNLHQMDLRTQ